jgi:hypothetical protein
MQGRILGSGQAYLETSKDEDGDWLAGENNYRLHLPPNEIPDPKQSSAFSEWKKGRRSTKTLFTAMAIS